MSHEEEYKGKGSFPPWSRMPSLKEMVEELGIDHDAFIDCLARDRTAREMSEQFGISPETASSLREHFIKYGIGSVMGGD